MPDITNETIDRVLGLAPTQLLTAQDGYQYLDSDKSRRLTLFMPPVPEVLPIHTLSSFVKLLENGFEKFPVADCLVQVTAFDSVELLSKYSDAWGRRQVYVAAKALAPERQFKFNEYMPQENFNIALRSMFEQDANLDALVQLAGSIAQKSEIQQDDDGFSQNVTAKNGTHLLREITVKPRVTLKPFRTFLEVEQPAGDFIFRVKNHETLGNMCALFEADAGRWKHTAMETIQKWLRQQITTSVVEAIREVPVIA